MAGGTAYYNEHDPFAAAWLREMIADGLIAPGEVDERSIEDVLPTDLSGFVQCHFFAGVGIWSLALRQAGWADDEPIWTGSCPCQPFSAAGKGEGFADERHLWPAFHWLIEQRRPAIVVGEQVAAKRVEPWIDLVHADMEALDYAFGCVPFPAAGFGAPHIRDRAYWVADSYRERHDGQHALLRPQAGGRLEAAHLEVARRGETLRLADSAPSGRREECPVAGRLARGDSAQGLAAGLGDGSAVGGLGNTPSPRTEARLPEPAQREEGNAGQPDDGVRGLPRPDQGQPGAGRLVDSNGDAAAKVREGHDPIGEQRTTLGRGQLEPSRLGTGSGVLGGDCRGGRAEERIGAAERLERPGPVNGYWRAADWLWCRDGKWRPVEPETFPLVDAGAVRNRVGLLRGAGNAVNLAQAQAFVEAVIETRTAAVRKAA